MCMWIESENMMHLVWSNRTLFYHNRKNNDILTLFHRVWDRGVWEGEKWKKKEK